MIKSLAQEFQAGLPGSLRDIIGYHDSRRGKLLVISLNILLYQIMAIIKVGTEIFCPFANGSVTSVCIWEIKHLLNNRRQISFSLMNKGTFNISQRLLYMIYCI